MTNQLFLVLLCLPLAWSACARGLQKAFAGKAPPADDVEKILLLVMLAPIAIGTLWLALSPWLTIHMPLPPLLGEGGDHDAPHGLVVAASRPAVNWGAWIAPAGLSLWTAAAVVRLLPVVTAMARLAKLKANATVKIIAGATVHVAEATVSPLAWGRHTIILPARLVADLSSVEIALIVRHEQAHLNRRDPLLFAMLGLIDALLWFNPFVRAQTARCRLAAELACDIMAAGKNLSERETYARVLIKTLKHTAGNMQPHAPAVISNVKSGDYRMRLSEIMHGDPAARKTRPKWLLVGLFAGLLPIAAAQFVWAQGTAGAPGLTVAPVEGPISSGFGPRPDPVTGAISFHQGVDFPVAVGTPVHAPGDGNIAAVYDDPAYGKVVEIDHGGGMKTRLAHLATATVAVGDHVTAGQVVATSGNSGRGTGPHLHLEIWEQGKPIDPGTVLPKTAT